VGGMGGKVEAMDGQALTWRGLPYGCPPRPVCSHPFPPKGTKWEQYKAQSHQEIDVSVPTVPTVPSINTLMRTRAMKDTAK